MLKKLMMWFWTKSKTIKELIKISRIIDLHTAGLVNRLEELDQDKLYVCNLIGASQEDIVNAKEAFQEAAKQMRWTIPNIVFLNAKIEEPIKKRSVKKK